MLICDDRESIHCLESLFGQLNKIQQTSLMTNDMNSANVMDTIPSLHKSSKLLQYKVGTTVTIVVRKSMGSKKVTQSLKGHVRGN